MIAEGVVIRCGPPLQISYGFDWIATKSVVRYTVKVQVAGLRKPLKIKVELPQGWDADILHKLDFLARGFGGKKPFYPGQRITVSYDSENPKIAHIIDGLPNGWQNKVSDRR